jgi:hypothetical protein
VDRGQRSELEGNCLGGILRWNGKVSLEYWKKYLAFATLPKTILAPNDYGCENFMVRDATRILKQTGW